MMKLILNILKQKKKLYSKVGNLIRYGLKLVPSDSNIIELKNLVNFSTK